MPSKANCKKSYEGNTIGMQKNTEGFLCVLLFKFYLLKYSSIAFAASFPAPIAEITVAAPVTASPPA